MSSLRYALSETSSYLPFMGIPMLMLLKLKSRELSCFTKMDFLFQHLYQILPFYIIMLFIIFDFIYKKRETHTLHFFLGNKINVKLYLLYSFIFIYIFIIISNIPFWLKTKYDFLICSNSHFNLKYLIITDIINYLNYLIVLIILSLIIKNKILYILINLFIIILNLFYIKSLNNLPFLNLHLSLAIKAIQGSVKELLYLMPFMLGEVIYLCTNWRSLL